MKTFTCGSDILAQFTRDPTNALDTACAADMLPPDFAGTPEVADWLLGTTDFWE